MYSFYKVLVNLFALENYPGKTGSTRIFFYWPVFLPENFSRKTGRVTPAKNLSQRNVPKKRHRPKLIFIDLPSVAHL